MQNQEVHSRIRISNGISRFENMNRRIFLVLFRTSFLRIAINQSIWNFHSTFSWLTFTVFGSFSIVRSVRVKIGHVFDSRQIVEIGETVVESADFDLRWNVARIVAANCDPFLLECFSVFFPPQASVPLFLISRRNNSVEWWKAFETLLARIARANRNERKNWEAVHHNSIRSLI